MLAQALENVRRTAPLVHNITNYVTVNDCANVLLAVGAAPIMADSIDEAADITAICGALNINIGTLNEATVKAMFAAGEKASSLGRPIVLDPVGAGASELRTRTAIRLMNELDVSVIRGNISELKALAVGDMRTRGVDVALADVIGEDTLDDAAALVRGLAKEAACIVVATGPIDIVSDAESTWLARNGHALMGRITGSGCMLSAVTAAFLAANPDSPLTACLAAVCVMGLAGEQAASRLLANEGNASYRNRLIDAVYGLSGGTLAERAVYERR
jgi:hydroxyethylthiazole kinase